MPDQNISDVNPAKLTQAHFVYLAFGILALVLLFYNPMVDAAITFNNEVASGALAIWGTVRATLSVLAIVMDADISGGIVVASSTVSPGAALKPISNMIVRFVDLLFALMLVSNMLALLIPAIAKIGAGVLALSLFVFAGFGFIRPSAKVYSFARDGVVVGVFFAIVVPASYTLSFWVGDQMTTAAWSNATNVVGSLNTEVDTAKGIENSVSGEELPTDSNVVVPGDEVATSQQNILSNALSGITSGMTAAVDAATNATGAVVGAAGDIGGNTLGLISTFISASVNLTSAFIQILVALMLKLIVLPILILGAAFLVIRRIAPQKHGAYVEDFVRKNTVRLN